MDQENSDSDCSKLKNQGIERTLNLREGNPFTRKKKFEGEQPKKKKGGARRKKGG